jgi:uncharacterized protein YgbK (DUF1537 family)
MTAKPVRPYGIAATLSDAIALTAAFGPGAKIGIGDTQANAADILAPAAPGLQPVEAQAGLRTRRPQYIFTFGNSLSIPSAATLGPVMDLLCSAAGTGFLSACLATPWLGRTVYQGHLFQDGRLQSDLKRDLAPFIDGAIALLPHAIVAAVAQAIRTQLTAMKERGVRLALLDAIDDEECVTIAEAVSRQPVIAGPAWISPHFAGEETAESDPAIHGPVAILSGALHRQNLMQTAAARASMPVLDLDFSNPDLEKQVEHALAWSKAQFGSPAFLISGAVPPDQVIAGFPATEILGRIALGLRAAGIRNFLLAGNDTAAGILRHLGIAELTAGPAFAGLRWLRHQDLNILIKPGSFGSKNLFLYDFEPQSRLNESAK